LSSSSGVPRSDDSNPLFTEKSLSFCPFTPFLSSKTPPYRM
jgi:hypothetical protein